MAKKKAFNPTGFFFISVVSHDGRELTRKQAVAFEMKSFGFLMTGKITFNILKSGEATYAVVWDQIGDDEYELAYVSTIKGKPYGMIGDTITTHLNLEFRQNEPIFITEDIIQL